MAVSHARPSEGGVPPAAHTGVPVPDARRGPGAVLLVLILPILCCGEPAIAGAVAAASAATLGMVGGVIGAVAALSALGLWVRHRRRDTACCAPAAPAVRR